MPPSRSWRHGCRRTRPRSPGRRLADGHDAQLTQVGRHDRQDTGREEAEQAGQQRGARASGPRPASAHQEPSRAGRARGTRAPGAASSPARSRRRRRRRPGCAGGSAPRGQGRRRCRRATLTMGGQRGRAAPARRAAGSRRRRRDGSRAAVDGQGRSGGRVGHRSAAILRCATISVCAPVAQWIERQRPKLRVGGSSPSGGASPCLTHEHVRSDGRVKPGVDAVLLPSAAGRTRRATGRNRKRLLDSTPRAHRGRCSVLH